MKEGSGQSSLTLTNKQMHQHIRTSRQALALAEHQVSVMLEQKLAAHSTEDEARRQHTQQMHLSRRIEKLKRRRRALGPHRQAEQLQLDREIQEAKRRQLVTRDAYRQAQTDTRKVLALLAGARSKHHRAYARQKRYDEHQAIARRAGVPPQYLNHLRVIHDAEGFTHFYFGGEGKPDGHWHGHYAVDPYGYVTYRRDPFKMRGRRNFIKYAHLYDPVAAH